MKIAIIGSRGLHYENFETLLPPETTEILSGGAKGIDSCARDYALRTGLTLTEFLPDYARYGRGATHVRNRAIVADADRVIAIWDGASRGTLSTIRYALKRIPVDCYLMKEETLTLLENETLKSTNSSQQKELKSAMDSLIDENREALTELAK